MRVPFLTHNVEKMDFSPRKMHAPSYKMALENFELDKWHGCVRAASRVRAVYCESARRAEDFALNYYYFRAAKETGHNYL